MSGLRMAALVLVLCTSAAWAQEFHLVNDRTGEMFGPFTFANGTHVRVDGNSYTLVKGATGVPSMEDKLKKTIIPSIEFRNASLQDVIDFLREASVTYSPYDQPEYKGVNLILNLGTQDPALVPGITFSAQQISLRDALLAVTSVSRLAYRIDGSLCMIEPARK